MNKSKNFVESQLNHLNRCAHRQTYHEFDNEIPHLEGLIPILDQSLESPFAVPYPPHEQVPATSLEK